MLENIRADLCMSYYKKSVSLWRLPLRFITTRGLRVVALFRLAAWLRKKSIPILPQIITILNEEFHTVGIHPGAQIGPGLVLPHAFGIIIGRGVRLGARAYVFNGACIGPSAGKNASPEIGDDFIAYPGSQVIGGITIGNAVHVGANALVIQDVPSDSTVSLGRQIILPRASQPLAKDQKEA